MEQNQNQPKKRSKVKGCLLIFIGTIVVLGLIGTCIGSNTGNQNSGKDLDSVADSTPEHKLTDEEACDASLKWEYSTKKDEMNDTQSKYATLQSNNYIEQDFPYQGETYARIVVRHTAKWGTDVMIRVDQGQIVGYDIDGSNYVTIRFDSKSPVKYTFSNSGDGSTEVVFLNKAKNFINNAKTAKTIRVEVPLYQNGNNVFKFTTTAPLKW